MYYYKIQFDEMSLQRPMEKVDKRLKEIGKAWERLEPSQRQTYNKWPFDDYLKKVGLRKVYTLSHTPETTTSSR